MTLEAEHSKQACTSCGAALPNDQRAAYCPYCGASQSAHSTRARLPASLFAKAMGVAVFVAATSFAITRLVIPDTAPPQAEPTAQAQEHSAPPPNPEVEARIQQLRDSLLADPENAGLTLRFANALYDGAHYQRAAEFYERFLLHFDSTNADARIDYAHTLFNIGKHEDALRETKRALDFHPSHQVALYNLGVMSYQMQDVEGARSWFEKCIAVDATTSLAEQSKKVLTSLSSSN